MMWSVLDVGAWVLAVVLLSGPGLGVRARGTEDLTEQDWVAISICRAHCFNHYADLPVTDSDCVDNIKCYMCWQMCERVHLPAWSRLCEPSRESLCPEGCQLACAFSQPETPLAPDHAMWSITPDPAVQVVGDDQLIINWPSATRQSDDDIRVFPIYALFWKYDQQPDWKPACFTGERWASIDGPHRDYQGLSFKLLAVLPSGVVAVRPVSVHYDSAVVSATDYDYPAEPESPVPGPGQLLIEDGAPIPPTPEPTISAPRDALVHADLRLAVIVESVDGVLRASLTWEGRREESPLFTVTWGRTSCRVQDVLPECELGEASYMSLLEEKGKQDLSLELPGLTYNSVYWTELRGEGGAYQRLTFYTPWCNKPDVTFTRCHPEPRFEAVTLPTLTKKDLAAVRSAGQVPMYVSLGVCVVGGSLMMTVAIIIIRRHSQLRTLLLSRASSLRRSLRSSASSLRRSIRGSASSFRQGFKDSIRDRMGQRRRAERQNIIYKGSAAHCRDVEESGSPMLPQRLLAKKSVSFSDQSDPGSNEYHEIDDVFDELQCPPSSPVSPRTATRSLPDIPEHDDVTPTYNTPHRKAVGKNSSPV